MGDETGKGTPATPKVPAHVQTAIDEAITRATDTIVEAAIAKVEELLNGRMESVSAALTAHKAEIEEKLAELATSAVAGGEGIGLAELEKSLMWAHNKIHVLVTAVERAVGINVSSVLPPAPGELAESHEVKVVGAETAN